MQFDGLFRKKLPTDQNRHFCMTTGGLLTLLFFASCSPSSCRSQSQKSKPSHVLGVTYLPKVRVFARHTFHVALPETLRPQTMLEVHDAYDANRNGAYIRLFAKLRHTSGKTLKVPGFAMRRQPHGSWVWQIRWSPRRLGQWNGTVTLERGLPNKQHQLVHHLTQPIQVLPNPGIQGPLVAPQEKQNKRYLRVLQSNGTSKALWLWGACRAWVVWGKAPPAQWLSYEGIDRKNALFPLLRQTNYNLLNQWMAPWEYLLIHRDRASYWKEGRYWKRKPYTMREVWRSYAAYDQGRALAFDALLTQSEGNSKKPTLYMLLSPIAHQNFQLKEHPWGSQESGWSPENDRGKQTPNKLNGFSGFQTKMSVWSFFRATPHAPLQDPRSRLFDTQANYYRYLIARWGYSRALGVWVLLDELDAVGGEVGNLHKRTGWWRKPDPSQWLGRILRMFRGKLKRSDGLIYQGDPFKHPLHAATTSFGGGIARQANVDWKGPQQEAFDLAGWHWYPDIGSGTDVSYIVERALPHTLDGILRYTRVTLPGPRLISEFGVEERDTPQDKPNLLYPSLYQIGIWGSVLAGHAGSVMDWDDGKVFGELRWKPKNKAFSRPFYQIDLTLRMQALQRFLREARPGELASTAEPQSPVRIQWLHKSRRTYARAHGFGLYDIKGKHKLWGWLYVPHPNQRFAIQGMKPGTYQLEWVDPWTGKPIPDQPRFSVSIQAQHPILLDAKTVLTKLKRRPRQGPPRNQLTRGLEVAFRLFPKAKKQAEKTK